MHDTAMGILGPVLRGQFGDIILIYFKVYRNIVLSYISCSFSDFLRSSMYTSRFTISTFSIGKYNTMI